VAIATITLATFRSISRGEAIAILIVWALIPAALYVVWRRLNRKGVRWRITVPAFVIVLLVLLVAYPKLVL
jgi:hypothetical protein